MQKLRQSLSAARPAAAIRPAAARRGIFPARGKGGFRTRRHGCGLRQIPAAPYSFAAAVSGDYRLSGTFADSGDRRRYETCPGLRKKDATDIRSSFCDNLSAFRLLYLHLPHRAGGGRVGSVAEAGQAARHG